MRNPSIRFAYSLDGQHLTVFINGLYTGTLIPSPSLLAAMQDSQIAGMLIDIFNQGALLLDEENDPVAEEPIGEDFN